MCVIFSPALFLIAPLPYVPGAADISDFLDVWYHPLLSEKFAALMRAMALITQPMEFVLPGARGPRVVRQGVAVFKQDKHTGRSAPRIYHPMVCHPVMSVPLYTQEDSQCTHP